MELPSGENIDGKIYFNGEYLGETENGRLYTELECTRGDTLIFYVRKNELYIEKKIQASKDCVEMKGGKVAVFLSEEENDILSRASLFFPVKEEDVSSFSENCGSSETGCYFDNIYYTLKNENPDLQKLFHYSLSAGVETYIVLEPGKSYVVACGLRGEAKNLEDRVIDIGAKTFFEKDGEKCFPFNFEGDVEPNTLQAYFIDEAGRIRKGNFP